MRYAEGVLLEMEKMWEESNVRVPMIGLLSMGSDPTNDIDALSKKMGLGKCTSPLAVIIVSRCRMSCCVYGTRSRGACQEGDATEPTRSKRVYKLYYLIISL